MDTGKERGAIRWTRATRDQRARTTLGSAKCFGLAANGARRFAVERPDRAPERIQHVQLQALQRPARKLVERSPQDKRRKLLDLCFV